MQLDEYRSRVERAVRKRDGEPIFNGNIEHANIIMEEMFANAVEEICILSGGLNARVYGPDKTIEQAELFLANGGHKLRILLEKPSLADKREHPFLKAFREHENVEIRGVPEDMQSAYDFHFAVMDDDSYRFEKDRTKHAAVASFGDSEGAENLKRIFEILWEASAENPVELKELAPA